MQSYRGKVSSKGQVVIPAAIRKRLKLRAGTEVRISENDGRLIIERQRKSFDAIRQLRGILRAQTESVLEKMEEDRKREIGRLERLAQHR